MKAGRIILVICVLLLCTGTLAQAIEKGDAAVPFSLLNPTTQSEVKFPELLEGSPALIVFFNTACAACESELVAAKTYLKSNPKAFKLIAIAIDSTSDSRKRVLKFAEDKELISGVTLLLDPKFTVAEKYGFSFTPASVGVDKDGKVAFVLNGFSRAESKVFGSHLDSIGKK